MSKSPVQPLSQQDEAALVAAAKESMNHAFVPVTHFPVGAAVLTTDGGIYGGCNTQSVISGMGVCAERSAIDHAVVHGCYNFRAIALVTPLNEPVPPCGMCQQYIGEFSQVVDNDIAILMVGSNGDVSYTSIRALSSTIFGPEQVGLDLTPYRKRC